MGHSRLRPPPRRRLGSPGRDAPAGGLPDDHGFRATTSDNDDDAAFDDLAFVRTEAFDDDNCSHDVPDKGRLRDVPNTNSSNARLFERNGGATVTRLLEQQEQQERQLEGIRWQCSHRRPRRLRRCLRCHGLLLVSVRAKEANRAAAELLRDPVHPTPRRTQGGARHRHVILVLERRRRRTCAIVKDLVLLRPCVVTRASSRNFEKAL
mmetsp:Transcript_23520/g.72357  ORF Transcript_23520/g.72357 Transcript_23520/m.72357 type:complete len:208 (-) Transcript_23520:162-785(-)